jgi:hypothetical protein
MHRLSFVLFRAVAVCLLVWRGHAADLSLLAGNRVRIDGGPSVSAAQHVAVDVSSNLVNWAPLMNVAPVGGQISFVNDITAADPGRFFRFADGDLTFSVSGFVDGGEFLGGLGDVTILLPNGTSTKSDARGFFHFDQRFERSLLPLTVTALPWMFAPVYRCIGATEAGGFTSIRVAAPAPNAPPPLNGATVRFHVKSGVRANSEFTLTVTNETQFTVSGVVIGTGTIKYWPDRVTLKFDSNELTQGDIYFFWSPGGVEGAFAGIPTRGGTLAGNGEFQIDFPPVIYAPESLAKTAFSTTAGRIQFEETTYSSTFNGVDEKGTYSAVRSDKNTWTITMLNEEGSRSSALTLNFTSSDGGGYTLTLPGVLIAQGFFQSSAYKEPGSGDGFPAPATLSTMRVHSAPGSGIGEMDLVFTFNGGAAGTFTALTVQGDSAGSGTFSYTPSGTAAHLRLDYSGPISGDYDDITLQFKGAPGSTTPSVFNGTQKLTPIVFPYSGTFMY